VVSSRPLRVLHGTYEIAGQGMMLARALRTAGVEADAFAYKVAWDGRVPDVVVDLDARSNLIAKGAAMAGAFAAHARHYDVFHFHFGTSFLPRQIDLPLLKAMGKLIVFHFHGCEIRSRAHMLATHRYSTCTECDPFCRPPHQDWLRAQADRYADIIFYSTLDLAESVPGGVQLPLAIECDRWEQAGRDHPLPGADRRDGMHGPVVVAHAPTNRLIKGTRHIEAAVDALRGQLPRLELRMIEHQPWATMPEFLSRCDILVDQVMMGTYGLLAMEGMSERRAVIAFLRDDFRDRLGDCPVQSANPETIAAVLGDLARDPARRLALGAQGAAYVRARHDVRVVGNTLLGHYHEAMGRRGMGIRA